MRSPFKRRAGLALASAVSLLALVGCGADDGEPQQRPEDLWGRWFISTAVTEDGEPRPLVPDTRIRVIFEERDDRGVVQWRAGCNFFGADLEVMAGSLSVGEIGSTEMACRDDLQEQDDWLADFFDSDPRWRLSDDRLMLTSDEAVVELEASRD